MMWTMEETGAGMFMLMMCCLSGIDAFNVDIPTRIIHTSPQGDSWFGFSVAMYKHNNINTLLVGAPKYNTTQPGVVSGGAVLSCSIEQSNQRCSYVPFDIQSHMQNNLGYYIDNKDNQFFGATLKSKNGVVLACAPLYVWFTTSRKKREPVGTCYVARKGMTDFQEFSPCRTHESGYHRQGSCQAGFDAALTNDGERMYISAPGAFYWQGQIHSQSLIVKNEYFATGAGHINEDDQYLGYSVATGHFTEDNIQDVALGVPKGLNYTGKVVLYSYDLVWLQNITGDQLGAYFGYCLAVADYNGDGLDDIIVGAPMYTDYENREMKIEVGKVHILLQNQEHLFERQVTYLGTVHRGRFGLSVASLGDINLDGFEDFAVGAPYGGRDGRGAVFIYHGLYTSGRFVSESMKDPMQIIYSADVDGISTFGWSLAGGIDVDGNSYPDLLVGAYEADKALLFKSRPIIKFLEHRLEFQSGGKPIDIKNQTCEIKRGHFFSCMDLVFCLTYNGVNVDDKIELEVEYHLDMVQDSEKRLLFVSNEQSYFRENIYYVKEIQRCRTLKTFLKPGLVDKLTPISANVSYSLVEERRFPRSLTPVLDRSRNISMSDALYIENNCGEDKVCVPDLVLTVDAPDQFIIGQTEMLNLSIRVVNNREDAFETAVYISEPTGMLFNKFERRENASCSVRKVEGKSWLKCDIGNPLPIKESVFFNVLFQQSGVLEEPRFEFLIRVNSTNKEEGTEEDNFIVKVVEAKLHAELTLFGSSDPESITYNTSLYRVPLRNHEAHFGPSLVHKYGLLNSGPSAIKKAEIMILWPTRTLTGKYLLYIVEEPITVGKIKCNRVRDINPLNLKRISAEERINILQLENIGGSHRISTSAQTDLAESETSSSEKKSSSSFSSSTSTSSSSSATISSSSSTEGSFESSSSQSSSVSSSGSSAQHGTREHSGGRAVEGGRVGESSIQGGTHSSRQKFEYERPSYSSTDQDGHPTSRGRTEGSYSSRSRTEGSFESSSSDSSVGSSGSSVQQESREHSGARAVEGGRVGETSIQGVTHSSRRHFEYEGPSYSYTDQDGHITSRGRTGGSYGSSRSRPEGGYSSSARSESGGAYYASSGDRKDEDYTSLRTRTDGNYSYSARGGSDDSYTSSSGHGTKIFYPSSAYDGEDGRSVEGGYVASSRGREEGSYAYRGGYSAPTSDKIGGRPGYSSQGIKEHEGPYTYSERPNTHKDFEYGQISQSGSTTGYSSSSGGGRRNFSSTRHQISRGGLVENQGQNVASSTSNARTQSGPVLPSSGSGGHFSSTLFTVDSDDRNNDRKRMEESGRRVGHSHVIHRGHTTGGSASSEGHNVGGKLEGHSSSSRGNAFDLPSLQGTGISGNQAGRDSSSSSSFSRHYHYNSSSKGREITHQHPPRDWTSDIYTATNDGGEDGRYHSSSYFESNSPGGSASSSSIYQESSSSSSYPRDESFYRHNEIDSRTKRDTNQGDEWQKMIEDCGATLCTRIRCTTDELATNEDVYVYIRSRLWVDTLNEDPKFQFPVDDVTISTRMVARAEVTAREIPPDMDIESNDKQVYSQNVVTPIRSVKSWEEGPSIPWWVILLATLAGILILLLIILILWKCGYFKRHRPRHKARLTDECHQPLNPLPTNGIAAQGLNGQQRGRPFYPGDEAL